MAADLRNPSTLIFSSLSAQISQAEHRLRNRRRLIQVRGAMLSQTFHQSIRDPTLLLWAGGMGFLMGEFTRDRKKRSQSLDHLQSKNHSFFEIVLNIIRIVNGMRTLLNMSVKTTDSSSVGRNFAG